MNRIYSLCLLLLCQLSLWAQVGATDDFNPVNPPHPETLEGTYRVFVKTQPEGQKLQTSLRSGEWFKAGKECSIHAGDYDNYKFLYWQEDGETVSTDREYTFTMPEHDVHLVAVYKFSPRNPANPNSNFWNAETGELIIDDFYPGELYSAIYNKVGGDNLDKVTSLTIIGTVDDWDAGNVRNLSQCTVLDLSRTKGMNYVPNWLFEYDETLTDVILPSSIERIEWCAFYNCTSLERLTCYAETPPYLDPSAFNWEEGANEGLIIYVPVNALSLYQEAEVWNKYTILPISSQAAAVEVSLPAGTDLSLYKDMFLELVNQKTQKKQRYVITERLAYTFSGLPHNTTYDINLVNKKGDILGQIADVVLGTEDIAVTFESLLTPRELNLTVKTPDGEDVTNQVTITWLEEDGITYLNSGAILGSMLDEQIVNYRVQLSEALATQYLEPAIDSWQVTNDNAILVTLAAIPTATMTGSVIDAKTGQPIFNATINISQTLNGLFTKSFSAKTNKEGIWSCEVFQAPSVITASATDYVSKTQEVEATATNIEAFNLQDINGTTILLNFTYTSIDGETENFYEDFNNVNYEVFNGDTGEQITELNVQYPQIVLMNSLGEGTMLLVKATSKNGKFKEVDARGMVDAVDKVDITLPILQFGGIAASFDASGNAKTSGILYDSNGHLVKTYAYTDGKLAISELPDGTYTLVTMGNSQFFNAIYDLTQFRESGLKKDIDYVQNEVYVVSGAISAVNNKQIPYLDETKLYYTGDETAITVNKSQVTAGQFLTLNSRIDFKGAYADKVSDVKLIVNLPQESNFVANSVMVGNSTASYTNNGQQVVIPLINYSDKVRFCIKPTAGGTYSPGASVQFTMDGKEITQPIGNVTYTVKDLSINVPSVTAQTTVPVSGVAVGKAEIEIYDNGMLAGKTNSLANGAWATTIDLGKPYNMSVHQIYAKIKADDIELASETKSVTYDKDAIQPAKVTMFYSNPEIYQNYELVFDFLNPKTSPMRYTYYIYNRSFTFTVDFTANDPERICNVILYVKTGDGKWHPLETTWDENKKTWVVSQEFGNMYDGIVPVNVDVAYNFISDSPIDNSSAFQTEMDAIDMFCERGADMVVDMITVNPEDNNTYLLESNVVDGAAVRVKVEELDYATASALTSEEQFSFASEDDGFFCVLDALTDNTYEATIVDTKEQSAFRMTLSDPSDPQTADDQTPSSIRNAINAFKSMDGAKFFKGLSMFTNMFGLKKYTEATGFKNWLGIFEDYMNNDQAWRLAVTNAIFAKCDNGYRITSEEKRTELNNKLLEIEGKFDAFHNKNLAYLKCYKTALANAALYEIGISVGAAGNIELLKALSAKNVLTPERLANLLKILGHQIITGQATVIQPEANFQVTEISIWAPQQNAALSQEYQELINEAKAAYNDCKPENAPTDDTQHNTVNPDCDVPIDPSGYVYEGVTTNRVQGATATIYYKEPIYEWGEIVGEREVKWDAEEYAQENPLFTDENGMYRWDVPQGVWQVKFEKEGYEPTQSEWLPVPPPQLDVNIAMTQLAQPEVNGAKAFSQGVEIEFDKYMMPESLTTDNIIVQKNGTVIEGTVKLLDEEKADDSKKAATYASKALFEVPEGQELTSTDVILLTIKKAVKSYAGITMEQNYQQELDVLPIVRKIEADAGDKINVTYGGERKLTVAAKPGEAAKGKILTVKSLSESIVKVGAETLTLDQDGQAELTITGELPGSTALAFTIEDSDVKGQITVNVKEAADLITLAPTASRISGAEVYSGDQIKLESETNGAKIYYTLDGTNPSKNSKIFNADEPIVITQDNVTIKAMAQGADLPESEVKEFTYTLKKTALNYQMPANWKWISHNMATPLKPTDFQNVERMISQTAEVINDPKAGLIGNLQNLEPTMAYKVKSSAAYEKQLSGYEFNASANAVPLEAGWNWIGYPVSQTMTLDEALKYFTPSDGDMIVGQDGYAEYDGGWYGTLEKLDLGKGYLYKSGKRSEIEYNTSFVSTAGSRLKKAKKIANSPWTYDKYTYPNIMPVTAELYENGVKVDDGEYIVGAFAGTECRGIGTWIEGRLMMNVYGDGGEDIHFVAYNTASERFYDLMEDVNFTADNIGNWRSPYALSFGGQATGIDQAVSGEFSVTPTVVNDYVAVSAGGRNISRLTLTNAGGQAVITVNELGRGGTITTSSLPEGVYIVTIQAEGQNYYQKIIKTNK